MVGTVYRFVIPCCLLCALIIAEEEQLVLDDGTADGSAELPPICSRQRHTGLVREGIARLLVTIAIEEEPGTVNFVRSGLGLHLDYARRRLAGFCVVILKRNLGFANRIQVRVHDDDTQDGILVIRAIKLKVSAREMLSVDLNLARRPEDFP